jgi:carbon monoxide dehydrogenase subunit G
MKLSDTVVIHEPPQRVWKAICDPATWPDWNPKVVSVSRTSTGPLEVGETFTADFKLNGPPMPSQLKVRVLNPLRQLTVKQRPEGRHRSRSVKIDFEIEMEGTSTRVTQTTDITEAGLPFWARTLMWIVTRFGKAAGPSPLDGLKKHLESSSSTTSSTKASAANVTPAAPAAPANPTDPVAPANPAAPDKKVW